MNPSLAFETTILRHCIASGPDGLSPLQKKIIESPAKVRVFSAPTGGGKSYAFQRAIIDNPKTRVLFIAPTRRLVQNLAASLVEGLVKAGAAADETEALTMFGLWTSDERRRLERERPTLMVGRHRVQELRDWAEAPGRRMIFATPESVAWLLFHPDRSHRGGTPVNVMDFLEQFNHIVFDEFHTIEARGFGLAALFCKITGDDPTLAKVTFLSATPIDVTKTLAALGVSPGAIEIACEEVVTGPKAETGDARALHGDVALAFEEADSLQELFETNLERIRETVALGGQVVTIFDSIAELQQSKAEIATMLDGIGVPRARRLVINSSDDPASEPDEMFSSGAAEDPMRFGVILATSSVEMGITLRATLMLMDPGYGPASFVQRVGRAARGDVPGRVIVRADADGLRSRHSWLSLILGKLRDLGKQAISVKEFLDAALSACRRTLEPKGDFGADAIPATFDSMPQRASWCAGLFWVALENSGRSATWKGNLGTGQKRTLRAFAPKQAGIIGAKLKAIRETKISYAKKWADAFEAEALKLRFILPSVIGVEPSGRRIPISQNIYTSFDDLRNAPVIIETDPKTARAVTLVLLDRPFHEIVGSSEKSRPDKSFDAIFPHESSPRRVGLTDDPVEEWVQYAKKELRQNSRLEPTQKTALEEAIRLVEMSRIVPTPQLRDGLEGLAASSGDAVL